MGTPPASTVRERECPGQGWAQHTDALATRVSRGCLQQGRLELRDQGLQAEVVGRKAEVGAVSSQLGVLVHDLRGDRDESRDAARVARLALAREGFDALDVGQVKRQDLDLLSGDPFACGKDLLPGCLTATLIAAAYDDSGAQRHEPTGDRLANPGGRARHDHGGTVQVSQVVRWKLRSMLLAVPGAGTQSHRWHADDGGARCASEPRPHGVRPFLSSGRRRRAWRRAQLALRINYVCSRSCGWGVGAVGFVYHGVWSILQRYDTIRGEQLTESRRGSRRLSGQPAMRGTEPPCSPPAVRCCRPLEVPPPLSFRTTVVRWKCLPRAAR